MSEEIARIHLQSLVELLNSLIVSPSLTKSICIIAADSQRDRIQLLRDSQFRKRLIKTLLFAQEIAVQAVRLSQAGIKLYRSLEFTFGAGPVPLVKQFQPAERLVSNCKI